MNSEGGRTAAGSVRERPTPPERAAAHAPEQARVRRRWWPGWIWAVPLAVLIIVGWLGVRALFTGGTEITIRFEDAHGVQKNNTNVEYRGTKIGQVTGVALSKRGEASVVSASIDHSAAKFLTSGTRFWLRGASPNLSDPSSLTALLSGPTIIMEPGPGEKRTSFSGLAERPISPSANAAAVLYEIPLRKAHSVKPGDPVTFHGMTVGEVTSVGFAFNPATGQVSIPATVALYPPLFHLENVGDPRSPAALRAAVGGLLERGLSARIDQDPPVVGSYRITLTQEADIPPQAASATNVMPQIPLAPGDDPESIIRRINRVPIERIAQNLLSITQHVDALASSPDLKHSIKQLSATLDDMHRITSSAGPQVTALIAALRRTADDLEHTATTTRQVLAGTAVQDGLESTLQEINEAARSVRSLSDYIDRHPESLIRGRAEAQ